MSARTLRLLVAFGFIFALFIYGLSTQLVQIVPVKSPEEGLLGGPIPGLTRLQLSRFEEGRALFRKTYAIKDGLGPLYNGSSCAECHGGLSTTGGAGELLAQNSITMIARRKKDGPSKAGGAESGNLPDKATPASLEKILSNDLDMMVNEGGPVLLRKSISDLKQTNLKPDCKIEALTSIPKNAEFHATRCAMQLYGLGLIDSIPDLTLQFQAAQQARSNPKVRGRAAPVQPLISGFSEVGKFGAKAQETTLLAMVAHELGTELGISNQLFRHSITSKGLDQIPVCLKSECPPDPNDDGKLLGKIAFYLQTLAPPPRAAISPEAVNGEAVFQKMGCAVCHIPQLKTGPKIMVINPDGPPLKLEEIAPASVGAEPQLLVSSEPWLLEIRALEKKPVKGLSDFLLHDMGAGLADGIAQQSSSAGEWRTSPLWGLRLRKYYLHDGRAKTLDEAIALHGGQAAESAKAFSKLSESERKNLLAFLNSL